MMSKFAMIVVAGLLLTQFSVPGSYNLGVPRTQGTNAPENNPATAIMPAPAPSGSTASAPAASAGPAANSGPAYSFGAAPPPVVSPGK